jgi:hypothetical protein
VPYCTAADELCLQYCDWRNFWLLLRTANETFYDLGGQLQWLDSSVRTLTRTLESKH